MSVRFGFGVSDLGFRCHRGRCCPASPPYILKSPQRKLQQHMDIQVRSSASKSTHDQTPSTVLHGGYSVSWASKTWHKVESHYRNHVKRLGPAASVASLGAGPVVPRLGCSSLSSVDFCVASLSWLSAYRLNFGFMAQSSSFRFSILKPRYASEILGS